MNIFFYNKNDFIQKITAAVAYFLNVIIFIDNAVRNRLRTCHRC